MKNLLGLSDEAFKSLQVIDWGYTEELKPTSYIQFEQWIRNEGHGPLKYLADHRKELRSDLTKVYPNAKSALVFLFDYRKTKKALDDLNPKLKLASYSLGFDGQDYHYWIKEKLDIIQAELNKKILNLECGVSLDIHPVLERDLAYRAGLGWFGKNSMLIDQKFGSYFLIGSLILNQKLELSTREIEVDHCGNCTRCLDACPTNAITDQRTILSDRCISTYTIEIFKDAPAPKGFPTKTQEVFGCDICQEVCPWNNKALDVVENVSLDGPLISFFNRDAKDIYQDVKSMSNNEYKRFFSKTSLERLGKQGLLKNLAKII